MKLSVIICTRNRAARLVEVLDTFVRLTVPQGVEWELLVVDNGSTDATPQAIESFRDRLPIRRVEQPVPGLSNARNAGVVEAAGDYILWTDDDVLVDPNWLVAYHDAFKHWPDASIFGGKIIPVFTEPLPPWFSSALGDLKGAFAERDFGETAQPLSMKTGVFLSGANWAIRTPVQKKFLFDPELGVAPGRRMGGEEIDVAEKVLASRHHGLWLPNPRVYHIIPASRQTLDYIGVYNESDGELKAYKAQKAGKCFLLFGVPPTLWLKLPFCYTKYILACLLGRPTWVRHFTSYAYRLGEFKTWRGYATGKKERPLSAA